MAREEDYPILIAQEGPLKGQRWTLSKTLMVGRDSSCDVQVQDRQVSRFHARLTPTQEGVTLEDLGSKNGTNHNGLEITTPIMLQDGDTLGVAFAQQFTFLMSDATMPLADGASPRGGRLVIEQKSRQVWVNQQQLIPALSAQQFKLLWMLYENQGRVVERADLVSTVWGEEQTSGVSDQALDALIRRLRDRLAVLDPSCQYINTVRGHGLRLDNPSAGD
ncbi:MAG: FHA domain-containing protein [Anaerolineales bacterium]|nr:FHA domain-containing protein [Anaerolineales bacterium]